MICPPSRAAALRHRLISEGEVASAALRAHSFGRVGKFIHEVKWRRDWKSWPALRRAVRSDSLHVRDMENPAARRVEEFLTGSRVIDCFANELVTTGYLRTRARMWFAAWWVHEARLPWQAGAAFFFRHLPGGDPASDILSWRWLAGLQTPGKTCPARRGNLVKYLDSALLAAFSDSPAARSAARSSPA